jgi:CMP-N,N'-diacetyllegionaminic acid synthase
MSPSIVALIPARAGSKRIPGKNTRDFFGHPLIAYTIAAAKESGIFQAIFVSTESATVAAAVKPYFKNATRYGAGTCRVIRRPAELADDASADAGWVDHALRVITKWTHNYDLPTPDAFAILRPTSPFRTGWTIRRAWRHFLDRQPMDSLRAVEPVRQHPLKMWKVNYEGGEMEPLLDAWPYGFGMVPMLPDRHTPFHSLPTQTLPKCYVQNASLEIAWTKTVTNRHTISGDRVLPFFTEGYEGFDLNDERDWTEATRLVRDGLVALPTLAPLSPAAAPQ